MKFTTALFALGSAVLAAAQSPNPFNIPTPGGYQPVAGQATNISWTPTTQGTVSIYLRSGNSAYLMNGTAIASSISNSGQYTWNVPTSIIRDNTYTFEIVDDADTSQVNYTPQFTINSNNLYSSTFGVSSGAATSTAASSGASSASGSSTTGSSASSGASSGSMTGTSSTSTSASVQALTSSHATGGVAARATAAAGMLGVIAFGALAL